MIRMKEVTIPENFLFQRTKPKRDEVITNCGNSGRLRFSS